MNAVYRAARQSRSLKHGQRIDLASIISIWNCKTPWISVYSKMLGIKYYLLREI